MSSRFRAQNKPFFKRRAKDTPGYVREYAYNEDGSKAIDSLTGKQIFRDRPNRALKRRIYALSRKDRTYE